MKFLNKLLLILFGLSLSTAVLAFCLDRTIMNAEFVTAQAEKSGVYTTLSTELAKAIARDQDNPQLQSALQRVVTAEYLQINLNQYLHALEEAYRTGGTVPTLDLSGIVTEVQALGVKLSATEADQLRQHLMIVPGANQKGETTDQTSSTQNPTVSPWFNRIAQSKWPLVLVSLVLGALVYITAPHNRWRTLGRGCFYAAAWLGVSYLLLLIIPNIAQNQLQKMASDNPLTASVNNLVGLSAAGVAQQVLFGGAGVVVVGIILLAISLVPHFGGHHPEAKAKDEKPHRIPLPSLVRKKD